MEKNIAVSVSEPEMEYIEMDTAEYFARFNRRDVFEPMCRACANWGARWGCPPFGVDPCEELRKFARVRLYRLRARVKDWPAGAGAAEMSAAMQEMRRRSERELLEFEGEQGGRAALFTGMCYHCGPARCARTEGRGCRHPELVRPSLEALGFDLGKTATEVFGCGLEWFRSAGPTPRWLTLLGAVFYTPSEHGQAGCHIGIAGEHRSGEPKDEQDDEHGGSDCKPDLAG
ncbi:MAG: DUF2284 domain-containing protein [Muribaculaceae bacterium]|nr:DUF2284 domain-containing protein [Muribaculaceae bacterium]